MKLVTFSVTNFRSITTAHKINLEDMTILVGKNNEGKSNIIKALSISIGIITNPIYERNILRFDRFYLDRDDIYFWKRDFPISFQNRSKGLETIFKLEFELNDDDILEFRKKVGSRINGNLEIHIKIGNDNVPKITVPKRGTKSLEKKSGKIREFIKSKIVFNYIPAIRTEEEGINIIRENLSKEIAIIEEKEEYKQAIKTINNIQQEILDKISIKIKKSLIGFIPTIKNVELRIAEAARLRALRRDVEVIIDDGTPTNIEYKGDGIKSLVSMGILTDRYNSKGASIIAIDEPESHLHPGAIRELNNVIRGLTKENQVIIATHNPQFVDASNLKNNIIVNENKASQCKNIKDIREILGIKVSDNLYDAKYILIVEGINDKKSLEKILKSKSALIQKAITSGELAIFPINGVTRLEASLNYFKNTICKYYIFIDNDNEARDSLRKAINSKLLEENQYNTIACKGMRSSEFEDSIAINIYKEKIETLFGVRIEEQRLNSARKKWSEKMKQIFEEQGKMWDSDLEMKIKDCVAECIVTYSGDIENLIQIKGIESINLLIHNLEKIIQN